MSNLYLLIYGMPFALAISAAIVLGSVCWLLELVLGRGFGVYAGYAAILLVVFYIARIVYPDVMECSGAFGREVRLSPCEWAIVSRVLAVFLAVATVPMLVLSEIKLRRWSLRRVPLTH